MLSQLKIDANTNVYCIIGYPVKHSISPKMQTLAFHYLGINAVYVSFEVKQDKFKDAIEGLKVLGIKGFNVTIPYKVAILSYLNKLSYEASMVGAVNTVVNENTKLVGYNTDVKGAENAILKVDKDVKGKALVIGAGGAARACLVALKNLGINECVVLNRTLNKAEQLALDFKEKLNIKLNCFKLNSENLRREVKDANIIVNATSLGMKGNEDLHIKHKWLSKEQIVFDVVYTPLRTRLIKEAEKANCKVVYGYEMLIEQGAEAFRLWTGKNAPKDVMRKVVLEELKKDER
jgi:shikimate dehydrogenase